MPPLNPPRVLLVDPADTRDTLAERLRMQGYHVTAAPDCATGAHLALSDPPAIVVADLWMSGISGVQLCRLLRSEPATEAVPVILRGPDLSVRDRFWAERAGAVAYVARGRMGDLVRALANAIAACPPQEDAFFTQLSGTELDLRDRIASRLDAGLFESVIASEVRALGVCGTFTRLFDLLSQFVARVSSYRWLAVYTSGPDRFAVHAHPGAFAVAEAEARRVLAVPEHVAVVPVEDEDALDDPDGPSPLVESISLGTDTLGRVALGPRHPVSDSREQDHDAELVRVVARELGGPVRIATLMEESQRLAMEDPLTGLLNRRAFIRGLQREIDQQERTGTPFSLMLLDIDHFKTINDQRGHPSGDAVLAHLGALLSRSVRRSDIVGRWGGEEFVVVLAGAPISAGALRAEAIRAAISTMLVHDLKGQPIPVTASIGLAEYRAGDAVGDVVDRADKRMYQAKAGGRNRVVASLDPIPSNDGPGLHERQVAEASERKAS